MERVLSPEEKIRRAEEIYYRRKTQAEGKNYARVNVVEHKKDFGMLKKMIIQILVCLVIYTTFYMIKNKDSVFSKDLIAKTNEILAYDINISKLYEQIKEYLNSFTYQNKELNENEQEKLQETQLNNENENVEIINEEVIQETQEESKTVEGVGGENIEEIQEPLALTQMEQDAKDVINTKSLINPLKGTITSRFGPRDSQNPIVSKNHTGIDIAALEGTVFIASMSGTVEKVSSIRRFRQSYKNCKR